MKKLASLGVVILAVVMALCAFSGCKKNTIDPDDPQKLEIYVYNAGYGYQWAEDLLKEFVNEPWVQEKYPGIDKKSRVEPSDVSSRALELLTASKKINNYDIVMGTGLEGALGPDVYALDLTKLVYESTVPGETDAEGNPVVFQDKMIPSYRTSAAYIGKGNSKETAYYQVNWASGMTGIIYNEDKLKALGFNVPNTTDELLGIMRAVKERTPDNVYTQKTSFATYGSSIYANYLYYTWWTQYQTVEEYINFYNGIDSATESRSPAIFKQVGIREALSVLEEILSRGNGLTWMNPNTGREAYRETQNRILLGNALFMSNGDWVDNELAVLREGLIEQYGHADTVKLMRTPIISAIVNRCKTITDENAAKIRLENADDLLSAVVKAIDEGSEEPTGNLAEAGVSKADFDIIKEARKVVYSVGPGHNAYIPSYASGQGPAVDFLRYMATDKAQEIYIRATNGASLPFQYDLKTKNPDLYEKISPMQQGRIDYFTELNADILPSSASFPLVRFGGLSLMASGSPMEDFTGGASAGSYSSLAEMIWNREYRYWSDNNNANWKNCLLQAGVQG